MIGADNPMSDRGREESAREAAERASRLEGAGFSLPVKTGNPKPFLKKAKITPGFEWAVDQISRDRE